jgi:tetratricopeptide (TPR) repeat protein
MRIPLNFASEESEKELYNLLKMAEKGSPVICICNEPILRESILDDLYSQLQNERIIIYRVKLEDNQKSVVRVIKDAIADKKFMQLLQGAKKVVLSISGLENTILSSEWEEMRENNQRPSSLQIINQQRGYFLSLPYPVLFWVSEGLTGDLQKFAPDFWVIRSAIVEFKPIREEMMQSIHQLAVTGFLSYDNLEDINRKIRIYRKLLKGIEDKWKRITFLLDLSVLHRAKGNYSEALASSKESLAIAKELEDKEGIAESCLELANVHYLKGKYKDAERLCRKSYKIFEDLKYKGGIACALHLIGMVNQERGEYDNALENYNESLKISEELEDKANIAYTLHEIGSIYFVKGEYEKALENYKKSLEIKEALSDRSGIASTLHQIGMIQHAKGEYDEALEKYKKSLKIEEEIGDRSGIASTLHQIGNIHQAKGEYEKALEKYYRSLKISEEIEDKLGIALTLAQVGRLKYEQKRYQEAISALSRAASIFEKLESPYFEQAIKDLGSIKEEIGEDERIKKLGDKKGIII